MNIAKNFLTLIFGCLIAVVSHAQSPGQPVTPKQFFPSDIVNVYSPDDKGWVITNAASNGIGFGKRGTENNETYGAQVVFLNNHR